MEKEQNKKNKNIGRIALEVIMVIVIIALSIVIGVSGGNDDVAPTPPPWWREWENKQITIENNLEKNLKDDLNLYLHWLPDSVESKQVHSTNENFLNLDENWKNTITVKNTIKIDSGSVNNTLDILGSIIIEPSNSSNNMYLINKNVSIKEEFDSIKDSDKLLIKTDNKIKKFTIGDQTKLSNRITDLSFFEEPEINQLQNYNLVIDNNNDGIFNEGEIVENNKVYEQLQQSHDVSLRVNLLNEWKPKIKLIFE